MGQLGANDVRYVGHLKYAADPLPADPEQLGELKRAVAQRPLWVPPASTRARTKSPSPRIGAWRSAPDLLTVIVPRHSPGAPSPRRRGRPGSASAALGRPAAAPGDAVYLVDAMGELGLWYRLAPIACIGGSLVTVGGHNPIEAAQLSCALLYGPHMFSVAGVAAELQAENAALVVRDADELAQAVGRLIEDRAEAQAMATAARAIAERNRHVIDRAFAALAPLLDRARGDAASAGTDRHPSAAA